MAPRAERPPEAVPKKAECFWVLEASLGAPGLARAADLRRICVASVGICVINDMEPSEQGALSQARF